MELWIRSQGKRQLKKVSDLEIDFLNFQKYGYIKEIKEKGEYSIRSGSDVLGQYKTEERALEVLDEIHEHIEKQGEDYLLTNENGIITGQKHYGLVYEMPKE